MIFPSFVSSEMLIITTIKKMNSNEPLSCRDIFEKIEQEKQAEERELVLSMLLEEKHNEELVRSMLVEEEKHNEKLVRSMLAKEKHLAKKKHIEKKKKVEKKVEKKKKKSVWSKFVSAVFPTPKGLESIY
jgi:hypothetical protein